MGIIFPLSWPGKIALMLVAVALGIIWSMLMWPDFWKKVFRKDNKSIYLKEKNGEKGKE